jgi:hypothetical protein
LIWDLSPKRTPQRGFKGYDIDPDGLRCWLKLERPGVRPFEAPVASVNVV